MRQGNLVMYCKAQQVSVVKEQLGTAEPVAPELGIAAKALVEQALELQLWIARQAHSTDSIATLADAITWLRTSQRWTNGDLQDVRRLNEAATLLRHPELVRLGALLQ